ncbi:hypothetical protein H0X32_00830 [Patescibacteria group bacterium]|nr:hypothetical protein [Patescibacteria group bacterium]
MKRPQIVISILVLLLLIVAAILYVFSNPQVATGLGFGQALTSPAPTNYLSEENTIGNSSGYVRGSIEIFNDNGFILTFSDDTTKVVTVSATTTIQHFATASSTPTTISSDQLSVGEQVFVVGTMNEDGSIFAHSVRTGTLPTAILEGGPYDEPNVRGHLPDGRPIPTVR